jgi:predicted RNA-binding protein YlxR (DUF448 family)
MAVREGSPERRCIVSGETRSKDALIRFVAGPDGTIVPDVAERLPGRGVWISSDRASLEKAAKTGAFARALKAPAKVSDDLVERVASLLASRCLDYVGFARRSGRAVAGFMTVDKWLRDGRAAILFAASDGAQGGAAKLRALAPDLPVLELLTSDELGVAFGRSHVVHAAIAAGPLANAIRRETDRLAGFRTKQVAP